MDASAAHLVAVTRVKGHAHGQHCLDSPDCPVPAAVETHLATLGDPLRHLARPGGRTVIKPNFVADRDREHRLSDQELAATCTDPVVLASLARAAWHAMDRRGQILLVDSPIEGTDMSGTLHRLGVDRMVERLRAEGVAVELRDLRDFTMVRHFWLDDVRWGGLSVNLGWLEKRGIAGDPEGYVQVDLGTASYFEQGFVGLERLRFHQSDAASLKRWHAPGRHIYSVARSVLTADLVISVPKLKTHKKSGVTLALKNMIGISNRKHWIPHYRRGYPPAGDELDRKLSPWRLAALRLRRFPLGRGHSGVLNIVGRGQPGPVEGGAWSGNDVVWRAARDLNTIVLYAHASGRLQATRARGYLAVVDGIVGGEGEGPLRPGPVAANLLVGGEAPLSVDLVASRLMGFPEGLLPMVEAPCLPDYPLGENDWSSIRVEPPTERATRLGFRLPRGWEPRVTPS